MATRKQIAAARRNLRKARAARGRGRGRARAATTGTRRARGPHRVGGWLTYSR